MDFKEVPYLQECLEKRLYIIIKTKIAQTGQNCWEIDQLTGSLIKSKDKLYIAKKAIGKVLDAHILNEKEKIFNIAIKWLPRYALVYTNNTSNTDEFILGKDYLDELIIIKTISFNRNNPNILKLPLQTIDSHG